jgi:hypothetical protein
MTPQNSQPNSSPSPRTPGTPGSRPASSHPRSGGARRPFNRSHHRGPRPNDLVVTASVAEAVEIVAVQ